MDFYSRHMLHSIYFSDKILDNKFMKKLIQVPVVATNLSKTLLYSMEYRMLYGLSKSFSFFVQPPSRERDKELLKYMGEKVIDIHKQDAQNIADGYYPVDVILPKNPREHIKNIPHLLVDSLRISRRRKLNINHDLEQTPTGVPEYSKRNYHFQTDGYFSDESAKLYEHQVEVLFSGTAAPMRRMLIKLLKEKFTLNRPLRILELGAGVGTATGDFSRSFKVESYTVTDISEPYLSVAKKRFPSSTFDFVQTPAESLPFEDDSYDLVFSVFLFHELPRSIRESVISEAYRVLKPGGVFGICDSVQKDDDPKLNTVLEKFPQDYHEPFYKDYTLWNVKKEIERSGFRDIASNHILLSKYWVARK